MPDTAKLMRPTAPCGPPRARRPALSGDCGEDGALMKTVVSATAAKSSSVVPETPAPRFGSIPAAAPVSAGGAPGAITAEGGRLTTGGGNGAPGPVVTTGAVSGASRG